VHTYENIRANPVGELEKITRALGASFGADALAKVVANNTFEKMQERERKGEYEKLYGPKLRATDTNDESTFKVRRGRVGGFSSELTESDISYANDVLSRLDYWAILEAAQMKN
jgi:hypothetical protein